MTSKDHTPYRRQSPSRELYDDADTEQREGAATPESEPTGDIVRGKKVFVTRIEQPARGTERRPGTRR